MSITPKLSICVPSRNRQIYFQRTIRALTESLRTDVQFVFADNSDEPAILDDFMRDGVLNDPRVVYLPGTGSMLSMVDNWERTVAASTGDWICVIGDDDYADPDLIDLIDKVLAVDPEMEAIAWSVLGYTWPHADRGRMAVFVPFDAYVVKVPQPHTFKRMFGWHDAKHVPTSGYSVYHSAISRNVMERIKHRYGGRYFEHQVVDYDNAFKVICMAKNYAFSTRPFSVMGSCPASNSFSIGKLENYKKKITTFIAEAGQNFEGEDNVKNFPFKSLLGTTATIAQAQHWFKTKYNLKYEDWEPDFAKACAMDVESYPELESFEMAREGYRLAFKMWKGGKYLKHFNPVFKPPVPEGAATVTSGFREDGVYLDQNIAGVIDPGELFSIIRAITAPADLIEVDASGIKYPWERAIAARDKKRA